MPGNRFTWTDGDTLFFEADGVTPVSAEEMLRRQRHDEEMILDVAERAAEKAASDEPEPVDANSPHRLGRNDAPDDGN